MRHELVDNNVHSAWADEGLGESSSGQLAQASRSTDFFLCLLPTTAYLRRRAEQVNKND